MDKPTDSQETEQDYLKTVAHRTVKAVVIIAAVILVVIIGLIVLLVYLMDRVIT